MKENEQVEQKEKHDECISVSEDQYFWNELHILVEDGVQASNED